MSFRIGVIQSDTQNDKGKNLDFIERQIDRAAQEGAQVIVLGENMHCSGENIGEGGPRKEPLSGYSIGRMRAKAKQYGIYIHCGSIAEEIPGEERSYNTTVFLGRDGGTLGVYRKLHTFDVTLPDGTRTQESARVKRGDAVVTVPTDLGVFGLSICYDLRFPELYRALALKGAQVLLVPANFSLRTGMDHWEVLLRARAIENGCYVVGCGLTGKRPNGYEAYGNSMVVDPWGTVIARMGARPAGLLLADIDLDWEKTVRDRMPTLAHRRTDVYPIGGVDREVE